MAADPCEAAVAALAPVVTELFDELGGVAVFHALAAITVFIAAKAAGAEGLRAVAHEIYANADQTMARLGLADTDAAGHA